MTPVHHAIIDYARAYAGIQAPEGDGEVGGLSLGQNVEPGGPLILLYSDDLDATVAAVKDAGGTIAEEPYAFQGGRRFTFFDPSGNRLGVWSTT
jgi:predicted enzyme related to lactoylglutathione lyase